MKYSELESLVLSKLDITLENARDDNILAKIPALCNACLGDIANSGKPLYKLLIFDVTQDAVLPESLSNNETAVHAFFVTFPADFLSLTNEFIRRSKITVEAGVVSDDGCYERVDGSRFRRLSSRQLLFPPEYGWRYLIQATFRYARITGSEGDADLDIEQSVLDLIPDFVVSELIRSSDVTLSVVYRNLYEAGLSKLDCTVMDPPGSFHDDGW